MKNNILLSIIITTTGRIETLSEIVQFYKKTKLNNVEFLISDNYSNLKVKNYINKIKDKRFRKVRTTKRLDITKHWRWIYKKTRGEFVVFNCDDSIISEETISKLKTLRKKADIFTFNVASFFFPDWKTSNINFPSEGNIITVPLSQSNQLFNVNPKNLVEKFSQNFRFPHLFPSCVNLIFNKKFADKLNINKNKLFYSPCPDVSLSLILLYNVQNSRFFYWDSIGAIGGRSVNSSMNQVIENKKMLFLSEMKKKFDFHKVLVDSVSNLLAAAISQLNYIYPNSKKSIEINYNELFKKIIDDAYVDKTFLANVENKKKNMKLILNKYKHLINHKNLTIYLNKISKNYNIQSKQFKFAFLTKKIFISLFSMGIRTNFILKKLSKIYCKDSNNLYIKLDFFKIKTLSGIDFKNIHALIKKKMKQKQLYF